MKINLSRNDLILIVVAALFSAGCFYFWLNYKTNYSSRNMTTIATLENLSSDVRWKIYGNFDWIKPDSGVELVSGDQIFTGAESMAIINFKKNDSKITLHSNSLITILESEDKLIMDIQKGSFDIEGKADESIQIKNKGIIQELPASSKSLTIVADKKGPVKVAEKIEVLPTIILPKKNAKFDIKDNISIKLSGLFNGRAEISTNENFSEIIKTIDFKGVLEIPKIELAKAQKYFLRISKGNLISPIQSFEITEILNIALKSPLEEEAIIVDRGSQLKFSWENPTNANDVLKIYSDNAVIKEVSTAKDNIGLYLTPMPAMSWEVVRFNQADLVAQSARVPFRFEYAGLKINNDILSFDHVFQKPINFKLPLLPNEKISVNLLDTNREAVINKFQFEGPNISLSQIGPGHHFLEIESLSYPSKEKSIIEVKAFADVVYFKGLRDKKNNSYAKAGLLEASKAEGTLEIGYESGVDLKNQLLNLTINGISKPNLMKNINKVNDRYLELQLTEFGDYCVAAKFAQLNLAQYFRDSKYCFKVTKRKFFLDLVGPKDQVLNRDPLSKVESYNIFLPLHKHAKKYEVQIFSDDKLKNIVYSGKSDSNIITWKSQSAGIFYYKYKMVDEDGNESEESTSAKLIFPISPFSDWSEQKK